MPDYVLDASAAAKTFRNEAHAEALRAFLAEASGLGERFLVPPVFDVEVRNVAARTAREVGDPDRCYDYYLHAMELVEGLPAHPAEDFSLAVQHAITVQDAQYLEAAARHGAILVSYDERQLAAGATANLETRSPGASRLP